MIIYLVLALPILYLLKRIYLKKKRAVPPGRPPICNISTGKVQGGLCYSRSGRVYSSFNGIPYAKPPTGKLRFLRPEPAEPWEGVKKCTKSVEFVQRNIFQRNKPAGKEDGLVVNVNTPNLQPKELLPVMVFIHGGGYVSGSGTRGLYGADNFMDKDIVFVTFNYRLSVLGGLYLDGKVVPGNQGMRDQVLALQWVQENIKEFGGDKERVTIFGESAGGMSVMNHYLSPMSRGLFSAAIAMSGSPLSPFVGMDKHPRYYGIKLAEHLGCDQGDSDENIIEKLQSLNPITIQKQAFMFEEFNYTPLPFKPIVDGGLVDDPFLPDEPLTLLATGRFNRVPLILGTNQNEGLLAKAFFGRKPESYSKVFKNFDSIGPLSFFHREKDEATEEEKDVCKSYWREKYGEPGRICKGKSDMFEIFGDILFTAPADITVKMISSCEDAPPVFHYIYNHQGPISLYDVMSLPYWKMVFKTLCLVFGFNLFQKDQGVCHFDEIFLMFKANLIPTTLLRSVDDQRVSDNLINLWTNFATNHNPTPDDNSWPRFDPKDPKYLEIGSKCNNLKYPENHRQRMEAWREVWEKIPPTMRHKQSHTWEQFKFE